VDLNRQPIFGLFLGLVHWDDLDGWYREEINRFSIAFLIFLFFS